MLEHPTPAARVSGFGRLRRRVARLARLLELDSPDVVLANEVLMVSEAAQLALGAAYYDALLRRDMTHLRPGVGLCQDCDGRLGSGDVNGLCEQCDAALRDSEPGRSLGEE